MAADRAAAASREERSAGSQLADSVGLCVMETMSKFEGKMESNMHSAYPWKILVPAERAKLPSKCKDTSRKMIDCVKAVELEKSTSTEPLREKSSLHEISVPSISDFEYHVLTVDDSKLDQKVVERLLKTSSYKGNKHLPFSHPAHLTPFRILSLMCLASTSTDSKYAFFGYAVTAVNSALRALEYLGLSESCPPAAKTNVSTVHVLISCYNLRRILL